MMLSLWRVLMMMTCMQWWHDCWGGGCRIQTWRGHSYWWVFSLYWYSAGWTLMKDICNVYFSAKSASNMMKSMTTLKHLLICNLILDALMLTRSSPSSRLGQELIETDSTWDNYIYYILYSKHSLRHGILHDRASIAHRRFFRYCGRLFGIYQT